MADPEEERPWYVSQVEEPPQAPQSDIIGGRSSDEIALSNYLSPEQGPSLVGGLGGGASSPAGGAGALMLPLLMAQMQQRQQITPLGTFANAYAQARGQAPPVQAPQGPSQYQQFEMIHALMKDQALAKEQQARLQLAQQAQQRLQDQAADAKVQRDKESVRKDADAQMAFSLRAMGSDQRPIRAMAADNFLDAAQRRGYPVNNADEVKAAITEGDLTPKRLDEVLMNLARGVPRDVIANWPGMSPTLLDSITAPGGAVAMMQQDTEVARKTKAAELNIKEAQVIEHKNPEFFKGNPDVIAAVQQYARTNFGTTYDQLPDEQKSLAMKSGILQAQQQKLQEYKAQQDIAYQKQAALAQLHGNIQLGLAKAEGRGMFQPAFMDKNTIWLDPKTRMPIQGDDLLKTEEQLGNAGFVPMNQKQADAANAMERAKQELGNMKYLWQQMSDRGLFSGSGNWPKGPLMAPLENFYKGTIAPAVAPTDTDRAILKAFDASKTALINIDRQLGSLGVRAFGAYGPQMNTLSPTTGKEGVQMKLSQVEDALDAQAKVQKIPVGQQRIWTPPNLKGSKQPSPEAATGAPDLQKPPMSRMTFEAAAARLRATYPPEQAEGKILWLRQNNRIVD